LTPFCPPFWGLKQWKNALFWPQTLFFVWEMLLKKWPVFGAAPLKMIHQGVSRRGKCPLLFWGFKGGSSPPHLQENFGHVTGEKWPQVDPRVTINRRWKTFYSILIHWEVAALWIQFWLKKKKQQKKKTRKIVIFRNFETSPRCLGNRKFTIVHAVTEAMVQSTCVPSFHQYWSILHSFIAVWTCNRRLFNENGHFSQYAHGVKG
jgi:hypothetical protein